MATRQNETVVSIRDTEGSTPPARSPQPWTPYSAGTKDFRQCAGCGAVTYQPGRDGWAWRPGPALTPGRPHGRARESACGDCAAARVT